MKFRIELNRNQTNDQDKTLDVNLSIPDEIKERFEKLRREYEEKVIERTCQLIRNAGCFNIEVSKHADGSVTVKGSS